MENSNDIIELLDELYNMVNEAWGVPLGNDKCIIERERAIEIVNTVKANLPTSIAESKRLVQARDEFIGNAKREAENLRKSAEDQAAILIDQQSILKEAKIKSEKMLSDAEYKTNELKRIACEYVDNAIKKAESTLNEALEAVRETQKNFNLVSSADSSTNMPGAKMQNNEDETVQKDIPLDDDWEEK